MRSLAFFYGIFAFVGLLCFLPWVYFTYESVQRISKWEERPGSIIAFDQSHYPTVLFNYRGKKIEVHSSYSSSDMTIGEPVTVHFPEGKPEEAGIKSFFTLWFLPLFLGIFWMVFGGIGIVGLLKQKNKHDAKNELFVLRKGKKISLPVSEITQDFSYTVNGRSPFIFIAQWLDPASNSVYQFKSDYIWYNPSEYLENKSVDVYIDPNDPERYYVDTSFLPKKAN